ncbi:hypothetical protein RHMOL_Rhmol01G0163600 [Rhododendron molle]|uniref:Uncharacterized protein n=1 Tax=Rhododendron molle TaxID=49168 RepID=A0ACC0Q3F8_RHOML|nr:hypothetical protein RHMOL_Rhmol01G0163600 [Rhododendron molle]
MRSGHIQRLRRRVRIALQLQLHSYDLIGPSKSSELPIRPLHHEIDILSHPLKPRNSAEIDTQTLSTKALTSRRRPSIRRSNPGVQTLTLGFHSRSNQSVNPHRSEAIKQLRDQGGEAQRPLVWFIYCLLY